jgi:hypothetical protein
MPTSNFRWLLFHTYIELWDVATPHDEILRIPLFSHDISILDTQYYEWKTVVRNIGTLMMIVITL